MMRKKYTKWTEEERCYLAEIVPGNTIDNIHKLMCEKFQPYTKMQITAAMKRYKLKTGNTGRFEKGEEPWNKGKKGLTSANKTTFKKGNVPANKKPIGSERYVDGYWLIKIAEPSVWELKHKILWEKEHGKIPEGYVLLFLDGDSNNITLDNLTLINRRQLLTLNQNNLIRSDAELTKTAINIADVIIKVQELKQR